MLTRIWNLVHIYEDENTRYFGNPFRYLRQLQRKELWVTAAAIGNDKALSCGRCLKLV